MNLALTELVVADSSQSWRMAGFSADPDPTIGSVRLRLVGADASRGITGWSFDGLPPGTADMDGVPVVSGAAALVDGGQHPNGVTGIDHVVLMTPNLGRTQEALSNVGLQPRRVRDGEMFGKAIQQVFYRIGEVILEVVGEPGSAGDGVASLWGITFTVDDIDATAEFLGDGLGRVKDAVQHGRRIATLRGKAYDISVPVAFISSKP